MPDFSADRSAFKMYSSRLWAPYQGYKGTPTLNTFLVYVPVITVPSGFAPDHLPTGITFFGRPYADATVINLAYAYGQAMHHRVPPTTTPALMGR
jgi:Asp-tRNA(Asn)/Glu-tRNA(Gln) amidotransferase A subunit family amidase